MTRKQIRLMLDAPDTVSLKGSVHFSIAGLLLLVLRRDQDTSFHSAKEVVLHALQKFL